MAHDISVAQLTAVDPTFERQMRVFVWSDPRRDEGGNRLKERCESQGFPRLNPWISS